MGKEKEKQSKKEKKKKEISQFVILRGVEWLFSGFNIVQES